MLAIHIHEPARPQARELARTPAFEIWQRARKNVRALFAKLNNQIGLQHLEKQGLVITDGTLFSA